MTIMKQTSKSSLELNNHNMNTSHFFALTLVISHMIWVDNASGDFQGSCFAPTGSCTLDKTGLTLEIDEVVLQIFPSNISTHCREISLMKADPDSYLCEIKGKSVDCDLCFNERFLKKMEKAFNMANRGVFSNTIFHQPVTAVQCNSILIHFLLFLDCALVVAAALSMWGIKKRLED